MGCSWGNGLPLAGEGGEREGRVIAVVQVLFVLQRLPCCLLAVTKGDAYLFAPPSGFSGGVRSLSSPCPLLL